MTTTAKLKIKRISAWLWRQFVEPHPSEHELPMGGPVELWTSRPTQAGEVPERKIAGVYSREQAHRLAESMGLLVYHVLSEESGGMQARAA